jgi:hypothetical protein
LSIRTQIAVLALGVLSLMPAQAVFAQYRDDEDERERRRREARYVAPQPSDQLAAPQHLIDNPTAGTLGKGYFDVAMRIFGNGGVLVGTDIALSNKFQVGVHYGADSLLGAREPNWNPRIGFEVKLQLFEEQFNFPAIAVGFIDQGYGAYIDSVNRYTIKSKGFFGVVSKNFYTWNVSTGFHGGINRSLEDDDGDESPDLFFGWDFHYNQDVSILAEYTAALNDNKAGSPVGKGRGYLNLGVRWEFTRQLVMEVDLTNLFNNIKSTDQFGREIRIVYVEQF